MGCFTTGTDYKPHWTIFRDEGIIGLTRAVLFVLSLIDIFMLWHPPPRYLLISSVFTLIWTPLILFQIYDIRDLSVMLFDGVAHVILGSSYFIISIILIYYGVQMGVMEKFEYNMMALASILFFVWSIPYFFLGVKVLIKRSKGGEIKLEEPPVHLDEIPSVY